MSDDAKTLLDAPQAHDVERLTVEDGWTAKGAGDAKEATRFPFVPAWYGLYFLAMSKTARELGYALALHGSMQRDCDVIAVPWTDDAVDAEQLIATFASRHGMFIGTDGATMKPHGRVVYSLMMGGHCYFDVSVMPRKEPP